MATTRQAEREPGAEAGSADERARHAGLLTRLLRRPALGAVVGAVGVWVFFAITAGDAGFLSFEGTANYLAVAAELGITGVAVAMLMIAGEFDLSIGSMLGVGGMIVALGTVEYGLPLGVVLVLTLIVALAVGFLNGYVVVRTGLQSFIVTLAGLFILRGLLLAVTRLLTGLTVVGGVSDAVLGSPLTPLFSGYISGFPAVILWWLAITALAAWVLRRTTFGNWIFGTGGDRVAARNSGVPVDRVRILLFMGTACAGALVGVLQTLLLGSADTLRGELVELESIIVAVVGGNLLAGGYGSAVGAFFGALTLGIVSQGFFFTGVDTDWFFVFLGALLLLAVLANNFIRRKALEA